jgi:putative DNA methylase
MTIEPFAWKNRPSLIESILPAQKISAEAQKERKAGAGQTLTALGSYWKGRKPLILVKACVLGALLPATNDPAADLDIFEKLMAIDDDAFLRREMTPSCLAIFKRLHSMGWMKEEEGKRLFVIWHRNLADRKGSWEIKPFEISEIDSLVNSRQAYLEWAEGITKEERHTWERRWVQSFDYLERVGLAKRPEELDQVALFEPVWTEVNSYLGTEAYCIADLVEQLGILRFGAKPKVGDTFSGGGSIPFEAARLGCDVYASDLNPVACMLAWGAFHLIGATKDERLRFETAQRTTACQVNKEFTELGVEHDKKGNRAKAFLYCLEAVCPHTGWKIPLAPGWVISTKQNVVARLIPDPEEGRFRIEIATGVASEEIERARAGTLQDGDLVYTLNGEIYRTPIKTLRGDYRNSDGQLANRLRPWLRHDFAPLPGDIFQERLYCIQWISVDSLYKRRPETFFAGVTDEDLRREERVREIVGDNLAEWQSQGLIPDMPIEPGEKTDEPIRTRGWTHWHHLFNPRQLLLLASIRRHSPHSAYTSLVFANELNFHSKLCGINPRTAGSGREMCLDRVFINQALNTLANYGVRSSAYQAENSEDITSISLPSGDTQISTLSAEEVQSTQHLWITDPPYGDAVAYHEITEYFIAWLRGIQAPEFKDWIWDSRRALAIVGAETAFRSRMIAAYGAMAAHMPDNGMQIVMFTHQDPGVWADMASIVWGAGLQVTAAWYIATETTSELKKGGYVQGTVLLVLRKRAGQKSVYRDELAGEIRHEVAKQIDTMVGLNQETKGRGRSENLFEDADLQMAGYAAALRVLTGYQLIDGQDMAAEALRPRLKGERDVAREMIDYAVTVANEHLVPDGLSAGVWERCTGPERFFLKMIDIEAAGIKKLDNYQNFAKAFRVADYGNLMGSMKANDARLKSAIDFKKATFEGEFGSTPLRALLFALFELQREVDSDEVMVHLRDLVPGYLNHREDLMAFCQYLASKREGKLPEEAGAARVLLTRIKNERLGG